MVSERSTCILVLDQYTGAPRQRLHLFPQECRSLPCAVPCAELHRDWLAIHPDFIAVCYRPEKSSHKSQNCEAIIAVAEWWRASLLRFWRSRTPPEEKDTGEEVSRGGCERQKEGSCRLSRRRQSYRFHSGRTQEAVDQQPGAVRVCGLQRHLRRRNLRFSSLVRSADQGHRAGRWG